jgi:phosphoribosylaminoimidazolecarboxamide formyltransferase/IMP cyclohydrolase
MTMKRALLSVWDKTDLAGLARELHAHGVQILSSGGTGRAIAETGIPFIEISRYTGAPEMMDGRVKTLHPKVHGGLLGRPGVDDEVMAASGIEPIDLLVVNLYPFEAKAAELTPLDRLVEYIDIGGPAMIRAAAKNYRHVAVITDPSDYPFAIAAAARGEFSLNERLALAKKAFARTARYDAAISNHLHGLDTDFPDVLTIQYKGGRTLRYGENPHQKGMVYGTRGLAGAIPLQGRHMSYNNYLDLDSACRLVRTFTEPCAVIVKHNNPCGVAIDRSIGPAYMAARDADPISAYGSVVALNQEVDASLAGEICRTYVEVVAAPSFSPAALPVLAGKETMRVLTLPFPAGGDESRTIDGGLLVQRTPQYQEHWEVVTERDPSAAETRALELAWKVVAAAKSNAIVFADAKKTLGIGTGQTSRVDAARIAVSKAQAPLAGSAVASDAFLPFPDTLEVAADAGATALVQPGGSIRDKEVIAAADRIQMAMIFTGVRYFRH